MARYSGAQGEGSSGAAAAGRNNSQGVRGEAGDNSEEERGSEASARGADEEARGPPEADRRLHRQRRADAGSYAGRVREPVGQGSVSVLQQNRRLQIRRQLFSQSPSRCSEQDNSRAGILQSLLAGEEFRRVRHRRVLGVRELRDAPGLPRLLRIRSAGVEDLRQDKNAQVLLQHRDTSSREPLRGIQHREGSSESLEKIEGTLLGAETIELRIRRVQVLEKRRLRNGQVPEGQSVQFPAHLQKSQRRVRHKVAAAVGEEE